MSEIRHSIKVAARRSGLSPHVIRIWEKRYQAVAPDRTATNRRLYGEREIERLTLLRAATEAGHNIGNVARVATDKLRKLVGQTRSLPPDARPKSTSTDDIIAAAVTATRELNSVELEELFARAAAAHGQHGLLENVIAPLAVKIGDLWRDGVITAAHEHFVSAVIRNFLVRTSKPYGLNGGTPTLIVATPAGQLHEIGAVMVAAAANDMGWRVLYLGTGLPAVEIAGIAIQQKARAVALSIVFPGDDPNLPGELEQLRKLLPSETLLIAGGPAAASYRATLKRVDATEAEDLSDLYPVLERLRAPKA